MSTKDYSNAQERMVADFLGWSRVPGSGAATCFAGDVVSDKFLGECKTHETPGSKIVFRRDVWGKICEESMVSGRMPVLIADDGTQKASHTYCIVRMPVDCGFLPESEFSILPYDAKFRKNLNFNHDDLHLKFKKTVGLMYRIRWSDSDILLMTLDTFDSYQKFA